MSIKLRDYFAGKALHAVINLLDEGNFCVGVTLSEIETEKQKFAEKVAKACYRYADAMMKVREKE